jgi:hypothetical protein
VGRIQEAAVHDMMIQGKCLQFLKDHQNDPRCQFVLEKYIHSFFNKFKTPQKVTAEVLHRIQQIATESSFANKESVRFLVAIGQVEITISMQ